MSATADTTTDIQGIDRIAIVGLGLIGGSIARGLRAIGYRGELVGGVRSEHRAAQARALAIVDRVEVEPARIVADADLVIVAVSVGGMRAVFESIAGHLPAQAVVSDAGSTKLSVIRDAEAAFGSSIGRFVAGHPIAGTERSGLEAGFATLFNDKRVILTPTPQTDPVSLARVECLWRALGARVSEMDAAHHDEVLAATSHLPHVLAYTLVDTLAQMAERTEIFEYAAGGFADFTRIASSDPTMWCDIVQANKHALLPVLDRHIADLESVRADIAADDTPALHQRFVRAKQARDDVVRRNNRG